jgi:hypothetical protein
VRNWPSSRVRFEIYLLGSARIKLAKKCSQLPVYPQLLFHLALAFPFSRSAVCPAISRVFAASRVPFLGDSAVSEVQSRHFTASIRLMLFCPVSGSLLHSAFIAAPIGITAHTRASYSSGDSWSERSLQKIDGMGSRRSRETTGRSIGPFLSYPPCRSLREPPPFPLSAPVTPRFSKTP